MGNIFKHLQMAEYTAYLDSDIYH